MFRKYQGEEKITPGRVGAVGDKCVRRVPIGEKNDGDHIRRCFGKWIPTFNFECRRPTRGTFINLIKRKI